MSTVEWVRDGDQTIHISTARVCLCICVFVKSRGISLNLKSLRQLWQQIKNKTKIRTISDNRSVDWWFRIAWYTYLLIHRDNITHSLGFEFILNRMIKKNRQYGRCLGRWVSLKHTRKPKTYRVHKPIDRIKCADKILHLSLSFVPESNKNHSQIFVGWMNSCSQ